MSDGEARRWRHFHQYAGQFVVNVAGVAETRSGTGQHGEEEFPQVGQLFNILDDLVFHHGEESLPQTTLHFGLVQGLEQGRDLGQTIFFQQGD